MWKLTIKSGLWELELEFDDMEDAAAYITETSAHCKSTITYMIKRKEEGVE